MVDASDARGTARGKQLLLALATWQRATARRMRARLLAAVTPDPGRVSLGSALPRWAAAVQARIAEAVDVRRRALPRKVARHARRVGWRRWCAQIAGACATRATRSSVSQTAIGWHATACTLRGWRTWQSRALHESALLLAFERTRANRLRAGYTVGLGRWRACLRRRLKWRQQLERRAAARGGISSLHRPCMQRFDTRAVFVEEGHTGLADAYRKRRIAAVVLCRWWWAVAVGSSDLGVGYLHNARGF